MPPKVTEYTGGKRQQRRIRLLQGWLNDPTNTAGPNGTRLTPTNIVLEGLFAGYIVVGTGNETPYEIVHPDFRSDTYPPTTHMFLTLCIIDITYNTINSY